MKATMSLAACLALSGCGGPEPQAEQTATHAQPANPPSQLPEPSAPPKNTPQDRSTRTLSAEGWGPLKIGMTLAQVTSALGPDSTPEAVAGPDPQSCDQFRPARAPQGMLVMIEDDVLTRISLISGSAIKTTDGIGVGDPRGEVLAALPQARQQPHEYLNAPALYVTNWTLAPKAENDRAARGIVYEINGEGQVGAIHAGGSSIQYVEGCS